MASSSAHGSQPRHDLSGPRTFGSERLVDPRRVRPAAWRTTALAIAAATSVAVAAGLTAYSWRLIPADWGTTVRRGNMLDWVQGRVQWTDEEWQERLDDVQRSINLVPEDPNLYDQLATMYAMRAQKVWTGGKDGSPEVADYFRVVEALNKSLALRPTHAPTWAELAVAQAALGHPPEEVFETWRRARDLGPYLPEVRIRLVWLAEVFDADTPAEAMAWSLQVDPKLSARVQKTREAEKADAAASSTTK